MAVARMRISMVILSCTLLVLILLMLCWLSREPKPDKQTDMPSPVRNVSGMVALRIGIMPERDVFEQRRRYHALADYLSEELGRPIELVTPSNYEQAFKDMADGQTDASFMGSMVGAMTLRQLDARVLVKPETADGVSTYRGVIFVRENSPIRSLEDLAGRSIAMIQTTTAGHLFPMYVLSEHGLLSGDKRVTIRWVGTHDQVIHQVQLGRVDAGAAKDLRIDAIEKADPAIHYRRLAVGEPVPNNALLVRRDLDVSLVKQLTSVLLDMDKNEAGLRVLSVFGIARFQPCDREEFQSVYDMIEKLGPDWNEIGVAPESALQSMRSDMLSAKEEGGFQHAAP